jgi:hypothetical protein
VFNELLLNGDVFQSSATDNATATVTRAAVGGVRHFVGGLAADYSAAVSAIKTVTLTRVVAGSTVTLVYRWDFAKGPFLHNLPLVVHGDQNTAVSVALEASGTGGITGRATIFLADV